MFRIVKEHQQYYVQEKFLWFWITIMYYEDVPYRFPTEKLAMEYIEMLMDKRKVVRVIE